MGLRFSRNVNTSLPHFLEKELDYLKQVIHTRLLLHFQQASEYKRIYDIPVTPLDQRTDEFAQLVTDILKVNYKDNGAENSQDDDIKRKELRILLLISLVPYIKPNFFDQTIQEIIPEAGSFPQLGGIRGKHARGFLPTGETALFLLAGENLSERFRILQLFGPQHELSKKNILYIDNPPDGEPPFNGRLVLTQDYVDLICLGTYSRPKFSMSFPAQYIETEMEWEDLVINEFTRKQIRELENWINFGPKLMDEWGMSKKLKRGYRVLFHGPPGTGKTLAASLLGKHTGKEVYRVDLSMVVSKFIGETEKNLSNLFARAENKGWILFFDEADALFGKRTQVRDAHDKYANQEVAYLLQRVEGYDGLVILASNFMNNIDEAFVRRFQSIIHFPMPNADERYTLWKQAFPTKSKLKMDVSVNFKKISKDYEMSGASIMNVVQYCCLENLARNTPPITVHDIHAGIQREFRKEGKVV